MWKTVTLGASCKMYQPKTISAKEMVVGGEYVVFGANGIIGKYHQYNHAEPQLLVTCRGATCGAVNVSEPFSWINGNAMVIQPDLREVSLKYMEYLFRGGIDLSKAITGAAQPQITRKSLEPIKFSYPPLAEQQRIVAKLDAAFAEIDRAIESSEKKLTTTNQLKIRSLAKLLSENKANELPTPLESCVETFHQGLNTAGEKVKFSDSGYPVLQTRNINEGRIDFVEKIKFVNEELWDKYKGKYKPQIGDVFFTNIGTIGKTAVVTDDKDYLIHWNIFKLRTKGNTLLPEFLKLNLDFLTDSGYFSSKQKGGTVNFVTKKMIGGAPICLCSIEEQERLLEISNEIEVACEIAKSSVETNLTQLASLKSAILAQELQPPQSEAA